MCGSADEHLVLWIRLKESERERTALVELENATSFLSIERN